MLFKFQWQKEKLFEQPGSGPGIVSLSPENTNNIIDMGNNNEQKTYVREEMYNISEEMY